MSRRQRPAFRAPVTNQAAVPMTARARAREALRDRDATPWCRIENKAAGYADVYLYSEIGMWGITADEFVKDLNAIKGTTINLRINSEGGEVFDGITIYNALRNHAATVNVTVDGLAASAASFIAMAGDSITMDRGSQMMIHDAMTIAMGNESDMLVTADRLRRASNTIASMYAERAGGTVESWRKTMAKDTWYTAEEAVAAGLADSCVSAKPAKDAPAKDGIGSGVGNDALAHQVIVATLPEGTPEPIPPADLVFVDDLIVDAPTFPVAWDMDVLRASIRAAVEPTPPAFSAELFRAAMHLGVIDVGSPVPPTPVPAVVDDESLRVDPSVFRRALREAKL